MYRRFPADHFSARTEPGFHRDRRSIWRRSGLFRGKTSNFQGTKRRCCRIGTAALVAFAAPALAADLPARTYSKAPAYTAPEVVYNWTGFYIGGNIGGAFADNNSLQGSNGRFMGGVQAGFDYQFAPNWVVGVEASTTGSPTITTT